MKFKNATNAAKKGKIIGSIFFLSFFLFFSPDRHVARDPVFGERRLRRLGQGRRRHQVGVPPGAAGQGSARIPPALQVHRARGPGSHDRTQDGGRQN